ncbi:MAG: hypothetical protein AAFU61_09725 [Pseudomonadota bacterium]
MRSAAIFTRTAASAALLLGLACNSAQAMTVPPPQEFFYDVDRTLGCFSCTDFPVGDMVFTSFRITGTITTKKLGLIDRPTTFSSSICQREQTVGLEDCWRSPLEGPSRTSTSAARCWHTETG